MIKKIFLVLLLGLLSFLGYGQTDPYSVSTKVSNPSATGIAHGAFNVKGPLILGPADTVHALATNSKYLGSLVYKSSDSSYYQSNGSYWEKLVRDIAVEFPLYFEDGTLKFASPAILSANQLLSTGGNNSLIGNTLTIPGQIRWIFNGEILSQVEDAVFTITNATSGYVRTDVIYIDSLGNILKQAGTQDQEFAVKPDIPYNAIPITYVNINGSTITQTPVPLYQQKAVMYVGPTGAPKTDSLDFSYDEIASDFRIGNNRAAGTTTNLLMNSGRAKIQAGFSGMTLSIGAGFSGPTDLTKLFTFSNRGTEYLKIGSTNSALNYLKLSTGTKLKVTTIDSLASPYNILWLKGDSVVKGPYPSGGGGNPTLQLNVLKYIGSEINIADTLESITDPKIQFFVGKGGAFRAGSTLFDNWNVANIGLSSFAVGRNTLASGDYSMALGINSRAIGNYSTAIGQSTTALGEYSTSFGDGTHSNGQTATAFGTNTVAHGYSSTTSGFNTRADGDYSFAMGIGTIVKNNASVVIGRYNDTTGQSIGDTSILFQIGNGFTDGSSISNIVTVKDDGVGINTIPTAKLHVNGSVRFEGLGEANGKVLTSDANGNATWETPSGGSSTTFVYGERFTGSTSTTITLAHSYTTNTVRVYKNGARLDPTTDYTQATSTTITLSGARLSTDVFLIDYNY